MFYRKDLNVSGKKPKSFTKTKVMDGFIDGTKYLIDASGSYTTYNFNYNSGALTTGLGVNALRMPFGTGPLDTLTSELNYPAAVDFLDGWYHTEFEPINGVFKKYIICYGSNKKFYDYVLYSLAANFRLVSSREFDEKPTVTPIKVDGVDYLMISNKTNGMFLYQDGNYVKQSNSPNITSICIHDGRLFATLGGDKSTLRFSDDLDPTNWKTLLNKDGQIVMNDERGYLNKVVSFKGSLYVFREFGISKVTVNDKDDSAEVSHLFLSGSRIYPETVCICGDKILMMLKDGIYSFNGTTVNKIDLPISKLWLNEYNAYVCAAFFNGKYYLATRLNFNEQPLIGDEELKTYGNSSIIELDVETNEINILRGVEANFMFPVSDGETQKLVIGRKIGGYIRLCEVDNSGTIMGVPTKKEWKTAFSDFGYPCQLKTLKRIQLYTKNDITLKIESEFGTYSFAVAGKTTLQDIYINKKGKAFALSIISETAEAYISNPKIVFEV